MIYVVDNVTAREGGYNANEKCYGGITPRYYAKDIPEIMQYLRTHNLKHGQVVHSLTPYVKKFYKELYYKYHYELITNKYLSDIMFDQFVNAGFEGIKHIQRMIKNVYGVNVGIDGKIGSKTSGFLNSTNPRKIFNDIKQWRIDYYHKLAQKPTKKGNLKGWLMRMDGFEYADVKKNVFSGVLFILLGIGAYFIIKE